MTISNDALSWITSRPYVIADGATGTNLFQVGLETGYPPELWNEEQPEKIRQLHQSFVDAGSDLILTNSFGGTGFRLKLHQSETRVYELNKAAAMLARGIADNAGRRVIVAGSIGPTGELFAPLGALDRDSAIAAFTEQAEALADGGADVLWIETMSALEEVEAATAAADSEAVHPGGVPVVHPQQHAHSGYAHPRRGRMGGALAPVGPSAAHATELCKSLGGRVHAHRHLVHAGAAGLDRGESCARQYRTGGRSVSERDAPLRPLHHLHSGPCGHCHDHQLHLRDGLTRTPAPS